MGGLINLHFLKMGYFLKTDLIDSAPFDEQNNYSNIFDSFRVGEWANRVISRIKSHVDLYWFGVYRMYDDVSTKLIKIPLKYIGDRKPQHFRGKSVV